MIIIDSVIANNYLTSSACLIGGYALCRFNITVNRFAVKTLGIPIDILNNKEYEQYSSDLVENNKQVASKLGITLNKQLGVILSDATVTAIREELSYRFLLETVVLPFFSSQFRSFSVTRTCISSLIFASTHLINPHSKGVLVGQFFNSIFLGLTCSLAQEKIGLFGAMCVHIGYNLSAWKYTFNQTFSDTTQKLRALKPIDILHPKKIVLFLDSFFFDACAPLILSYKAAIGILKQSSVLKSS
ncbi:MAG: hypothetical protein K940chlam1_01073 [Candidatus Anoxychlamydiales bacterium]|nr:hypothetical protein [Candidatus Anoxychlamydiales bacterium]NGX35997.1 hypothetical protein [Candidatus Anoxychlamydiales bacterium]